MRKLFTIFILFIFVLQGTDAQQDAMFTKYAFNTLSYNPAYAGSKGFLSMGVLHRTQWWGVQGAPHSQNLWVHTPLKGNKVGLGFSLANDMIGPTNAISASLDYSYIIPLGKGHTLSVGLKGGITNWRADWRKLNYETLNDEAYADTTPNYWLPNFGGGLYYSNQGKYFIGIGVPSILENDLRKKSSEADVTTEYWAKQYRHYYFSAGGAIPLDKNRDFVFRPMALVKTVGLFSKFKNEDNPYRNVGAPTEFDIDISVFFYKTVWLGASFRSSIEKFAGNKSSFDSADLWLQYHFRNGLHIGAAYDYSLTNLQQPAQGSFEVMLGYDFNFITRKIATPRYF